MGDLEAFPTLEGASFQRWSLRWVHSFIFPPWENSIMAIDMKGENPTAQIYEIYHMALSIVLFQKLFAQITIFFI
jgi:hypothetical protein